MATLDLKKLRKVHGLMTGGATEGERAAARSRAESIAKSAGMSLKVALSKLNTAPQPTARSIFEGFDDWMDARRRAEVLAACGSEAAVFARTEREALLDAAVAHLATWDYWTGDDGTVHRFAKTLDGRAGDFWNVKDITPAIRKAVTGAYPWPATLADALAEVKAWDRLARDRGLFCRHGEWNHYAEVNCRVLLLEDELETSRPVASWDDMQARFNWKRYAHERTWVDPQKRDEPFLEQLEADFAILRANAGAVQSGQAEASPAPRRTNAQKRADVLSMLDSQPELSDREIARRSGVSPQTVGNHRRAPKPTK